MWSVFLQRLPSALNSSGNHLQLRLSLFFSSATLPVRSLRFVGWIVSSSLFALQHNNGWIQAVATVVACVVCVLLVTKRVQIVSLLQYTVVGILTCVACELIRWQFDLYVLMQSSPIVTMIVLFLSTMPIPWFQNSLLVYSRRFVALFQITIVVIIATLLTK